MVAETLESIESSEPKRAIYTRILLATFGIGLTLKSLWFSRLGWWQDRELVDFDTFYIVAQRAWLGDVDQAYWFLKFVNMQREAGGASFMPWTYPPQFDLLVAPFALLPIGVAYFLFTAVTLAFFLVVLRRVAGRYFALSLVILFPTIEITLACGQNGFLTAGLIGVVCLFFEKRQIVTGLALGLMVIKPHLAIAFAVYSVLRRRWITVVTAAAVVLGSSMICTAVFGVQIWTAWLEGLRESGIFLEHGFYPLFRMISFYAALRTSGLSASAAFLGQAIVAVLALGIIALALYRRLPARRSLAIIAMLSVSISPYAYDYDFQMFGIGLALLLPELKNIAREGERTILYIVPMIIGGYGTLRTSGLGSSHATTDNVHVLTIAGFMLVSLIAFALMVLLRSVRSEMIARKADGANISGDVPIRPGAVVTDGWTA